MLRRQSFEHAGAVDLSRPPEADNLNKYVVPPEPEGAQGAGLEEEADQEGGSAGFKKTKSGLFL